MRKHILIIWLGDKADVEVERGVCGAGEHQTLALCQMGASPTKKASITLCDQQRACDRGPSGSRRALAAHL